MNRCKECSVSTPICVCFDPDWSLGDDDFFLEDLLEREEMRMGGKRCRECAFFKCHCHKQEAATI
jgi:hypothetical protein